MSGRPDYDVGDLVVCVNSAHRPSSSPTNRQSLSRLRVGRVYRVRLLTPTKDGVAVELEGIPLPSKVDGEVRELGFHPDRFRKVDPLPDALTSLLASKPVRESIPA